jgi:putative oxygen-independent coproporphyrinogen III oxidase
MSLSLPPLALYIHIPWCVRKCPYCDFNSHARGAQMPERQYVDALIADLEQDLPLVWGRPVVSIFFGGGTPSLFSAASIGEILQAVQARMRVRPGAEITLETNPGTAEFDSFEGYLRAGVNRISFGVQSFDDEKLRVLGRIHDGAQAGEAVRAAQRAGVNNINLDLMFALPGQTQQQAIRDIELAVELAPQHISHYHLTMEPNTVFAAKPPANLPDDDAAFAMQEACQEKLRASGFAQYEISAYAKPGLSSAHNMNYWLFGDYLGIGAGAHGKITDLNRGMITRYAKQRHPAAYMESVALATRIQEERVLTKQDLPFEFMLNGLRLIDGFSQDLFAPRTGLQLSTLPAYANAKKRGLLLDDNARVRASELGLRFLNDTVNEFLPRQIPRRVPSDVKP